ncbi:MAG: transglutaminase-like cysteine peptidase [Gammaproteobacteria bacterium]
MGLLLVLSLGPAAGAAEAFAVTPQLLSRVEKQYGEYAKRRVARWGEILRTDRQQPESRKLVIVNNFFNQLPFLPDQRHWGQTDYWATPLEFLETDGGDCEDFALAKYFTLRELGVPAERLRLTYVKSLTLDQAHMVVTYYKRPGAEPLVLDNLDGQIKRASLRPDLLPVYSFNGEGLWLAKQRGLGRFVGSANRLSLWQGLKRRMRAEGLELAH